MVSLSAFFSRLIPRVHGCSEPLAQQALLDSAIDFCNRSLAVVEVLDPVTLPANVSTLEVETPSSTTVSQVLSVKYDGERLAAVDAWSAEVDSQTGRPRYYFGRVVDEVFSLTFYPTPETTVPAGVVIRAALRPTRSATTVPEVLYDRYADAIVDGALGYLHAVQDQPFSNDQKALLLTQSARIKANAARVDALHGRAVSSMSVQLRSF